jgi:hypothetical protein
VLQVRGGIPAYAVTVGTGADPPAAGLMGRVDRLGVVANIGSTLLTNTMPQGFYRIRGVGECTTLAAGAGSVSVNLVHTDDVGSVTDIAGTIIMTATGRTSLNGQGWLQSGDWTWNTTGYTAGTYAIHLRIEYAA